MKKSLILLILGFTLIIGGCFDDDSNGLEEIKIIGLENGQIKLGEKYSFEVCKFYENGKVSYGNATWASSNPAVVKVNDEGEITALKLTTESAVIITAKEETTVGIKEVYVIE